MRSRTVGSRTLVAALVLAAESLGCLGIVTTSSQMTEQPGETRTRRSRTADPPTYGVDQVLQDSLLRVTAYSEATCVVETYQTVHPTRHDVREFTGSSAPWYYTEWICGVGCTAGGVVALALAPGMSSETSADPESGGASLDDQTLAYLAGAGGVALGVGMLISAIVDSVRVMDTDTTLPDDERLLERRTESCDRQPIVGVAMNGIIGSQRVNLGATDSAGSLVVDLSSVLPPAFPASASATAPTMSLLANNQRVGSVDLTAYVATLEAEAWAAATAGNSAAALEDYLLTYPSSLHAATARMRIEEFAWAAASSAGTPGGFRNYLGRFPSGPHAPAARGELDEVDWAAVSRGADLVESYRNYLQAHPDGAHAAEAEQAIDDLAWEQAREDESVDAPVRYLEEFPAGRHAQEARLAVIDRLIAGGDLNDATQRIADFDAAGCPADDIEALNDRIARARREAERRVQRARDQAMRIAAGCGSTEPRSAETRAIALRAYQKLDGIRGAVNSADFREFELEIAVACYNCSRDCANGN